VSFYKISNDQVASSNLITTMQVCIWLLMLHKMMKGIEVRIPSVKVQYLKLMCKGKGLGGTNVV
jgi:hypothetical protein